MLVLNRSAIKNEAKSFISYDKRWWRMFIATLLVYIFSNGINIIYNVYNTVSDHGIRYYDDSSTVTVGISAPIIGIILIPFMTAICGYYLNHIRGFNPDWRSLYKEGFDRYGKYLIVGLARDIVVGLWSLLFIIPGIVKYYAYSQVDYIIHDNPNLTSSEARKMSDIMTKGYKSDLFVLDLSFILWYWLVAVSFGIAGIYVLPYNSTVKAMYYENLKKHSIDAGLIAPEAFGLQTNVDPYDAPFDDFRAMNNGAPAYSGSQNGGCGFVPEQAQNGNTANTQTATEADKKADAEPTFADGEAYEDSEEDVTAETADGGLSDNNEGETSENKEVF